MKIEDVEVYGFRHAIQAARRPLQSWAQSDTVFVPISEPQGYMRHKRIPERPAIGPKDLRLLAALAHAGGSHRKCLRLINIWCVVTAPRYIWHELDTYAVGTDSARDPDLVRVSESTRHVLFARPLEQGDFLGGVWPPVLERLNSLRKVLREVDRESQGEALADIRRLMPEGFLQSANYKLNYEVALRMIQDRTNHPLPEWKVIVDAWRGLPYMEHLVRREEDKE